MPEGPEIRLAADKIAKVLVDKPILSFFFGLPDLARWEEDFASSYVISIETRGKALLTHFANGLTIYSHNQLYGRWYVVKRNRLPSSGRSLRMAIHTAEHSALLYSASDISVWETQRILEHPFLAKLGPDILSEELTWRQVASLLSSLKFRNRGVGAFYLDQGFVAGIGNYLRSEILFFAKVNPWAKPNQLSTKELNQLARATLDVSRRSYKTKGVTNEASRVTQLKKLGQTRSQFRHAVFGRESQACYDCGSDIIKDSVASRRLYWCPACQYETSERL
jgi:endonuclease-8|tara:strand:- start:434 stop:1270 length:837 start_codon:yes stop_codon:yes gene_type:complete